MSGLKVLAPVIDRTHEGQALGYYAASDRGWIGATTALVSGTRYFTRFYSPKAFTSSGFGFRLTTASGTNDPCEVVVYSASGTFLASSGSVSGKLNAGSNTNQAVTLAQAFTAYTAYYVGFVATSTASLVTANFGTTPLLSLWSTTVPSAQGFSKAAVGIGDIAALSGYAAANNLPLLTVLF